MSNVPDETIEKILDDITAKVDTAMPIRMQIAGILRHHLQTDQPSLAGCDEAFEQWWKVYPRCKRKVRKEKCLGIWQRRWKKNELPGILPMLATLEAQRLHWQEDDWTYVPLPQTYLNGAQWTDEVEAVDCEPTPEESEELEAKRRLFDRRAIELVSSGDWNRVTRAALLEEVGLV